MESFKSQRVTKTYESTGDLTAFSALFCVPDTSCDDEIGKKCINMAFNIYFGYDTFDHVTKEKACQ